MKALRRSLKNDKDRVNHISITPKSAVAIVPPKKVIRALYDYEAQSHQELSFTKGDFFHVIGRENDTDWYEACNPALPDARGLVPVAFFQALGRTERDSGQSEPSPQAVRAPDHDSGYSDTSVSATLVGSDTARSSAKTMAAKGSGAMVYGIVMYDFVAERPDELDAKAGEAIIVIAQSNPEWFVAKPIGRLGGPGLIPVSFIEIRDMGSGEAVVDASEAVQRAGVPKVEEWKKMAAEYKNSSITLGKFEPAMGLPGGDRASVPQGSSPPPPPPPNGRGSASGPWARARPEADPRAQPPPPPTRQSQPARQPQPHAYGAPSAAHLYAPVAAKIPRYCFAEDKYWFVIEAALEDGRHWELSRYYEDFYDFQIALLTEFPTEAGNTGQQKRSLPYMPGPVSYVTDAITEGRQHNLDAYVTNLLAQPPYISRCALVKQFFAPREGDFEIDPSAVDGEYRLSGGSQPSSTGSPTAGGSRQSSRGNLNAGYGGLSAAPTPRGHSSHSQDHGGGLHPRQMSALSPPPHPSPSPGLGGPPPSAMKVKIYYGDDLIAIRVPTEIQYPQLHEKIRERLRIPAADELALFYKDESTGERPGLLSNHDLDVALRRNDKLIIYAAIC